MPGESGPGTVVIPPTEASEPEGTPPSHAPGTIGAVGEMDFTGEPAGTTLGAGPSGGEPVGETYGGGPGEGMMTTGGTGPAVPARGGRRRPQRTLSTMMSIHDPEPVSNAQTFSWVSSAEYRTTFSLLVEFVNPMWCLLLVLGLKSVEAEIDGMMSPCVVRVLRLDN